MERFPSAKTHPGIIILRVEADLYFANIGRFKDKIDEIVSQRAGLKGIIIDGSTFNTVDPTSLHVLDGILVNLQKKGIKLALATVRASVRDTLKKAGIVSKLIMDPKLQIHDAVHLLGGE